MGTLKPKLNFPAAGCKIERIFRQMVSSEG
jgi:hypothetical protein